MISVNTLKQYLKKTDGSNDSFLQVCINSSVGEIESYCNRKFESGTYTDYLDGKCNSRFFLKNYPVVSISSIDVRSEDTWEVLSDSTSAFILHDINAVQLEKTVLPRGKNNVKITYSAGWETDECNSDMKGALLEMASLKYYDSPVSGQARLGKSSVNIGSQATESSSYKDLNWKDKVSKYRIRIFK